MSVVARGLRRVARQGRVLLAFFACRAALAVLLSAPIARLLVVSGVGAHPRGDALLFDSGGLVLAEAVRASHDVLRAELRDAVWLGALFAWLLLLPFGALVAALTENARTRLRHAFGRGAELFGRFTLLGGATWLAQGLVLALAVVIGVALHRRLGASSERSQDLTALAVFGLGGLGYLVAAVVLDLGRLEVAAHDVSALRGLGRGLARLRARPSGLLGTAAFARVASLGLLAGAARVTGLCDVSRPGTWRVITVLVVHQAAMLGLITLQAVWLALAIELGASPELSEPTPASGDRFAGSAAPGDPSPSPGA